MSDPLRELVALVDRLVSPGGCPWDAEQTHDSLVPYLVEESYEVVDAVAGAGTAAGDADLAEELGDLLLQVVFHARIAQGRAAFDIDAVARGISAKLVRRHPHVFADEPGDMAAGDAATVEANWEVLKAAEKPARGVLDGIPLHLPALARAQKVLSRLDRAGLDTAPPTLRESEVDAGEAGAGEVGAALFALVAEARRRGVDAEEALRRHVRAVERHHGATPEDARTDARTDTPADAPADTPAG